MDQTRHHSSTPDGKAESTAARREARWFERARSKRPWLDLAIKIAAALVGVLLIVAGIAIAPVPGPGGFIAFFGIAILAAEFRWARRLTRKAQVLAHRAYAACSGGHRARWAHRWKKRVSSSRPAQSH